MRKLAIMLAPLVLGCGDGGGVGMESEAESEAEAEAESESEAEAESESEAESEGEWDEWVCDPLGDLSAVEAAFESDGDLRAALEGIAEVRYPTALAGIDATSDDYLASFCPGASTFDAVMVCFMIATHEGMHLWDIYNSSPGMWSYRVTDDLIIETADLSNFARSEILAYHTDPDADGYADVYLTGVGGGQGFNTVLEEFNAYVHTIPATLCTREAFAGGVSGRDGALAFMYYVELYLKVARLEHAADYEEILDDPGHIDVILTNWARAEFWLGMSAAFPALGIDDDMIAEWVYDDENLAEIDLVRERASP